MSESMDQQEGPDGEEFLPGFPSVSEFSGEGIKKIIAATKAFQSLPAAGPAWDLQKSYPEFNRAMKSARSKLVPMISSLLRHANIPTDDFRSGDIDEKFDFVVESNDDMLERIGSALDEASGRFKKAENLVVNQTSVSASLKPPGTWGKRKALDEQGPAPPSPENPEPKLSNRSIKKAVYKLTVKEKPQVKFKTPVDNSLKAFVPMLKEKPNSIKPLSILPEYNSKNEEFYGHPYLVELNKWEPLDSMLIKVTPQSPRKLDETPLVEVTTARDLENLLKDLYQVSELAIDLEHHGYRSYLGFTCLMQISTREKDYIVDGLALRQHLYMLNEIFTNPKVVKVLHGSNSDIEWLQKDFGLYIVNMFDTQIAAKLLNIPQLSLQALLNKYCNITQNKTFQLADWRIRPLHKDMIHYARQDTHFLLFIYDSMRNELIESGNQHNNLLLSCYDQSKLLCLKRYEKPGSNPNLALRKMRRSLNNRQMHAYTEIYKWRDEIAREKDESIAYVLPNHMLLMISEQMPKEMTGILACCDPVPQLVQTNLGAIHKIITTARELPLQQEHVNEEKTEKRQKLKDWVILMNSVHDVSLSEIADPTQGKTESEEMIEAANQSENEINDLVHVKVWPQPLKEPAELNQIQILERPSVFFNHKMYKKSTMKKPCDSTNGLKSNNASTYTFEAAATPFERYQLSKEIMEMMKDPSKKDSLDMENPVVKAVYETVFCDPADEQDEAEVDEKPQELNKVFTEGEFIPFNPLADGGQPNKKRKRKDQSETWNDGNEIQSSPKKQKLIPFKVDEVSDPEDFYDGNAGDGQLGEFMAVSNTRGNKASNSSKKNKKKNKAGNILNKLKKPFTKKKVKESQAEEVSGSPTDSQSNRRSRSKESLSSPSGQQKHQPNHSKNQRQSGSFNAHNNKQSPNQRQQKGQQQDSSPKPNHKGSGRQQQNKKKGGGGKFYDFRSRGSGKSMTFK